MKKKALLLVAVSLFVATPVMAMAWDGNKILKYCKESQKILDNEKDLSINYHYATYCKNFIAATMETHRDLADYYDKGNCFCLPKDGFQIGQAIRIVVRYLETNPDKLHYQGSTLSLIALNEAFPCE